MERTRAPAPSRTSKRTTSSKRILRSWWFTRCTVQSCPPGMAMRNDTRLSMQVPHRTQSLPPAFSAMLPPMVQAQALVGSVAKTRPRWVACSMADSVMTPASRSTTWPSTVRPSSRTKGRVETPRMWFSFSVFTITQSGVRGMAPPVRPVPAPARDGVEPQVADGRQERSHLRLLGGGHHRQRKVQAPVGGVGGVGDERERVEQDVLAPHHGAQRPPDPGVEVGHAPDLVADAVEHASCLGQDLEHQGVVPGTVLDDPEVRLGVPEEALPACRGGDELLAEVGVPPMDQDLAEDPHEQPGRAPSDPPLAQLLELRPDPLAEQGRHRLPVVGGRVVVGDLAVAGIRHGPRRRKGEP